MPAVRGAYAFTIHAEDLERAAAFYRNGLGLGELHRDEENVVLAIPGSPPLSIHRWGPACRDTGGRPPGTVSGLMLLTDDAKAMCERVAATGGSVTAPPWMGPRGALWSTVADPEGNELLLCEPDA